MPPGRSCENVSDGNLAPKTSVESVAKIEALSASEDLSIGDTLVRVAQPEDLVIYKAIAWRPQDQQDVERLLAVHGARMDLTRVRRIVAELAAALEEPERVAEIERVIRRALS